MASALDLNHATRAPEPGTVYRAAQRPPTWRMVGSGRGSRLPTVLARPGLAVLILVIVPRPWPGQPYARNALAHNEAVRGEHRLSVPDSTLCAVSGGAAA